MSNFFNRRRLVVFLHPHRVCHDKKIQLVQRRKKILLLTKPFSSKKKIAEIYFSSSSSIANLKHYGTAIYLNSSSVLSTTLTVTNSFAWSAALASYIRGLNAAMGILSFSSGCIANIQNSNTLYLLDVVLENYGNIMINSSTLQFFGSANQTIFINEAGGTIDAVGTTNEFNAYTGTSSFNNYGLIRINGSSSSSTFTITVPFDNNGTVAPTSGEIYLDSNGIHSGTFDPSAGSIIFIGGTNTLTTASTVLNGTGITFSGTKSAEIRL